MPNLNNSKSISLPAGDIQEKFLEVEELIEDKITDITKVITWHKSQLTASKKQKSIYKCIRACQDSGAILLEMGELAKLIESDSKFCIRSRGIIEIIAKCLLKRSDEKSSERISDWIFDLTSTTTKFCLDQTYTYSTLPYPLYIPDLSLDEVDKICDAHLDQVETESDSVNIEFTLPCMLVQIDLYSVYEFLRENSQEKTDLMKNIKPVFSLGLEKIKTLS